MAGETEESKKEGFMLLGILDVQNTPCARDAILHGVGASVVTGLLHFLLTSRSQRSVHVGFGGYIVTTLGSWFYCRFNNAKLRVEQRTIQEGIRNMVTYEGSRRDPTMKPSGPS